MSLTKAHFPQIDSSATLRANLGTESTNVRSRVGKLTGDCRLQLLLQTRLREREVMISIGSIAAPAWA